MILTILKHLWHLSEHLRAIVNWNFENVCYCWDHFPPFCGLKSLLATFLRFIFLARAWNLKLKLVNDQSSSFATADIKKYHICNLKKNTMKVTLCWGHYYKTTCAVAERVSRTIQWGLTIKPAWTVQILNEVWLRYGSLWTKKTRLCIHYVFWTF